MMTNPPSFRSRLEAIPRLFSGVAVVVGLLVLAGWNWDIELFKRIRPGFVAMNPTTAALFVVVGISLWVKSRPASQKNDFLSHFASVCALFVLSVGLLRLFSCLSIGDSGIDQHLFADKVIKDGPFAPNRMSPNTALSFVLLALGLLSLDRTARRVLRPAEFFVMLVAVISLLAVMGYAYRVQWFYAALTLMPMALHTAVLFLMLAVGVLCCQPEQGAMAVITSNSLGGALARRQFSGMVCILFILGWLRLEGERHGFYGADFGVTIYTVTSITLFGALILWSSHSLHVADSERKQIEAERERFFTLSLDMLCIAGMDGFFKRLNPAFQHVLGYTTEELMARPFLDFVHPDDIPSTVAEMEKLSQGEMTVHFENRYRCKDGSWRWLSWKTQPVKTEGLLYATASDVTERKETAARIEQLNSNLQKRASQFEAANAELLTANRFLDSVIENIPDMIFVKDAVNLRFVRFNRAGEDLVGYPRDEMFGKNDYDFFPKAEADAFTSKDREVLAHGQVVNIPEEPIRTRNNGERILRTKKIPVLDENDQPRYLLGISEDVTEKKEREREILLLNGMLAQRANELEAVNQELESFSYSISHDLRAPLRHVQGYVEMLHQATEGQLTEKALRYLKIISEASVEMGVLIDDLLAFSRMGRVEMKETPVSLNALLRETMRSLEIEVGERRIEWKLGDLPAVLGDPTMLKQVLVNLIGNAIKYSRARDPAEIEIGCSGKEEGRVILFVRDNGAGFDMQYVHKLFGVFQRLHRADDFEGTGIGLAIVRRVITRHGGRVWAEGALNRGATFYFTLKPELAI